MVLVTGGTGLVGSHLLFELSKSQLKIRALYRTKETIENVKTVFSFYTIRLMISLTELNG